MSRIHRSDVQVEWTTREQLILASAVQRSGDQNWVSVSRAIKPLVECDGRPSDYFSQKNCAQQYSSMLDKAGTHKRKRSITEGASEAAETAGQQIVRELTEKYMSQLNESLSKVKKEYQALKEEIELLEKGELDSQLPAKWEEIQKEQQAKESPSGLKVKAAIPVSKSDDHSKQRKKKSPSSAAAQVKEETATPAKGSTEPPRKKLKVDSTVGIMEGITTPISEATPLASVATAAPILTGSESVTTATAVSCPAFVSTGLDLTMKPVVSVKKEPLPSTPSPSVTLESPIPRATPTFAISPMEDKFSLPMQTPQPSTQISGEVHVIIQQPNMAALNDKTKGTATKPTPHLPKMASSQDVSVNIQRPSPSTVVLSSSGSSPTLAVSVHSGGGGGGRGGGVTSPAMAVSVVKQPVVATKDTPISHVSTSLSNPVLVERPHVVVGGGGGGGLRRADAVSVKVEQKREAVLLSPVKVKKMDVSPSPAVPTSSTSHPSRSVAGSSSLPSLPSPSVPVPTPTSTTQQSLPVKTTQSPGVAAPSLSQPPEKKQEKFVKPAPSPAPVGVASGTSAPQQLLEKSLKAQPMAGPQAKPTESPPPKAPTQVVSRSSSGVTISGGVSIVPSKSGPLPSSPLLVSAPGRQFPGPRHNVLASPRQSLPTDPRIRPPPPPPYPPPPSIAAAATPPGPPPLPPPPPPPQQSPVSTPAPSSVEPVQAAVPRTVAQLLLKKEEKKKPVIKAAKNEAVDSGGRKTDTAVAPPPPPPPSTATVTTTPIPPSTRPPQPPLHPPTTPTPTSSSTPAIATSVEVKPVVSKTTDSKAKTSESKSKAPESKTKVAESKVKAPAPARTAEERNEDKLIQATLAKTTESRLTLTKTTESKLLQAKTSESKAKATESKAKISESKLTQGKITETKQTQLKPAETKTAQPKTAESKLTQSKSTDIVPEAKGLPSSKPKPSVGAVSIVTPSSNTVSIVTPSSSFGTPASTIEINVTPAGKSEGQVTPVSSSGSKYETPVGHRMELETPSSSGGGGASVSSSEGAGRKGRQANKEGREEGEGDEMDEETPVKPPTKSKAFKKQWNTRSKKRKAPFSLDEVHSVESTDTEDDTNTAHTSTVSSPAPSQSTEMDAAESVQAHKQWKKAIIIVWRHAAQHKYANLFLHPVREEDAPGYKNVILRPMDLSTIKKKIELGQIKTDVEFQRDMLLMFQNAFMYNNSEHEVYMMAQDMKRDVMENIQAYLTTQAQLQLMEDHTPSKTLRSRESRLKDTHDDIFSPATKKRRTRADDN